MHTSFIAFAISESDIAKRRGQSNEVGNESLSKAGFTDISYVRQAVGTVFMGRRCGCEPPGNEAAAALMLHTKLHNEAE